MAEITRVFKITGEAQIINAGLDLVVKSTGWKPTIPDPEWQGRQIANPDYVVGKDQPEFIDNPAPEFIDNPLSKDDVVRDMLRLYLFTIAVAQAKEDAKAQAEEMANGQASELFGQLTATLE